MPRRNALSITITARCEKHPGFNHLRGMAGVKGGCQTCQRILVLAHDARQLQDRAARLNEPEELRRAS